MTSNADQKVLEREAEFWQPEQETRFKVVRRRLDRALGAYDSTEDIHDFYDPTGLHVFDFGCGAGDESVRLLELGASHVTGIDIAPAMIEAAKKRAAREGLTDRTTFLVGDVHATPFDDESFDLVVGVAVLHHLDLDKALREIWRVLKRGGKGVFLEPLWHNPILRVGRALTPNARVESEHPLTEDDWELCRSLFPEFEHHERECLSIPLMPLNFVLPLGWQQKLAPHVHALDRRLFTRYPPARKYSRITILILQK